MTEKLTGKILALGMLGSFFFAFTFVLNRSMALSGGYWIHTAVLRYVFTLIILFLCLIKDGKYKVVLEDIKAKKKEWFLWSTVGFGVFYMPLAAASLYAESWFTCAIWQITIVTGIFLTPLFGKKIPVKNLLCSLIILVGIALMQLTKILENESKGLLTAFLLILVASIAYPLGNRKTMIFCSQELSTTQRVFGMTLCSMPFWCVCSVIAFARAGMPSSGQVIQSFAVALISGVIATVLYFHATDIAKNNPMTLALAEATICAEVIFTLVLGVVFLHDALPTFWSMVGMLLIVIGMVLNSFCTAFQKKKG